MVPVGLLWSGWRGWQVEGATGCFRFGRCAAGREGVRREEVCRLRRKVTSGLDCRCQNRMDSVSVHRRLASLAVGLEDKLYEPFGG